ncbi:MAG: LEA type 2 family protein [Treponema sp.]|nr:LEA type 2 family protein [Treponema sp.]
MNKLNYRSVKKILAVAALAVILSLPGCQTLDIPLREPSISFHSAELLNVSFEGVQLLCKVRVENPNPIEIPFPQTGWELFISDNSFISGVINNNQRLRARGTAIVDVPVNINYLGIFNSFRSISGSTQVPYKIALAVTFSLPILGDKVFNLVHEGELPIPQLPRLSSPSMRVESTDLTRAVLLFSFNVNNPNSFQLPKPNITYSLLVNRTSFLNGGVEDNGPLAPNSTTPINLRLQISYADLLRVISSLLTTRETSCLLRFTLDYGIPAFADPVNFEINGNLPLPQLPRLNMPTMRIESTDMTRTVILVTMNIENTNAFELPSPRITYDYQINRSSFIRGGVENLRPLAASSVTPVNLRLQVNYADLLRAFSSLVSSREAASLLTFSCDFGVPFLGGPQRQEIAGVLPIPRLF